MTVLVSEGVPGPNYAWKLRTACTILQVVVLEAVASNVVLPGRFFIRKPTFAMKLSKEYINKFD